MTDNQQMWNLAECFVAGTLTAAQQEQLTAILATSENKQAFNESVALIKTMKASAKNAAFKQTLRGLNKKHLKQLRSNPFTKVVTLPAAFWRTSAVAASVALLTSTITYWSLTPSIKKNDSRYSTISREVEHIKKGLKNNSDEIDSIKKTATFTPAPPSSEAKYTGTGFAVTNDGYFVTAYHVLNQGKFDSVYIQTNEGRYYKATLIRHDDNADIAIMKVDRKNFKFTKSDIPYTLAATKDLIGTHIFALGYPNDEEVYSEGYIASKNGFEGNNLQYTLQLPAGHGQSGSPVLDASGNVIGMLTAIGAPGESATYAVSTKALSALLEDMQSIKKLHLPKFNQLKKMPRELQLQKLETCTFSVKVYTR
jgi:serine protease Do